MVMVGDKIKRMDKIVIPFHKAKLYLNNYDERSRNQPANEEEGMLVLLALVCVSWGLIEVLAPTVDRLSISCMAGSNATDGRPFLIELCGWSNPGN